MARAVGIGLDTTNSAIAVLEGGEPTIITNAEGVHTAPSVVTFSKTGEIPVGRIAKCQAVTDVDHTISSIKRHMGTNWKITIDDKDYTAQEILARILPKLKVDAEASLGEPVTDAVITVPAYLNDAQCQAAKDADQIAGLNVQHIVSEPTAATLAYGLEKDKEDELILVFDLGGDTFGIPLLEIGKNEGDFSTIQVRATASDNRLGGDDWDQRIVDWLITQVKAKTGADLSEGAVALQRLKEAAEWTKKELSSLTSANISLQYLPMTTDGPTHLDETLTYMKFEEMTFGLLERTEKPFKDVIRDASISTSEIDHVVLIGGLTHMPAVTEVIKELTGSREPNKGVNPDEVVAVGAALQASVIQGDREDVLLVDVTPLSLSIETKGGIMTKLISRNAAIPTRASEVFSTAKGGQPPVLIQVYQSKREFVCNNKLLGTFELSDITPAPRGVPQIEVIFDIDTNGIVHVSTKDRGTGEKQSVAITGSSALPKGDIDRVVKEAEEHATEGKKCREKADTCNQTKQVVYSVEKLLKDEANKVTEGARTAVRADADAVREALRGEDVEAVKSALDTLNASIMKVGEKVYTAQQAAKAKGKQAEASSVADDDVIDAEIVGEDESK